MGRGGLERGAGAGGVPGSPPPGDGVFNQLDIIAALNANVYLAGPYVATAPRDLVATGGADGLHAVVPEPSSTALFAAGIVGLLLVFVRRKP